MELTPGHEFIDKEGISRPDRIRGNTVECEMKEYFQVILSIWTSSLYRKYNRESLKKYFLNNLIPYSGLPLQGFNVLEPCAHAFYQFRNPV